MDVIGVVVGIMYQGTKAVLELINRIFAAIIAYLIKKASKVGEKIIGLERALKKGVAGLEKKNERIKKGLDNKNSNSKQLKNKKPFWLEKKILNTSDDSAALRNMMRFLKNEFDENWFYVIAHGSKNGKNIDYFGRWYNAENYAKIIKNEGWKEGTPIKLIVCNSGKINNGFGEKLSNILNVTVEAPSKRIAISDNGEFIHENGGRFINYKK